MNPFWHAALCAYRPLAQARARLEQPSVALAEGLATMPSSGAAGRRGALFRRSLRWRMAGLRTGRLRLLGR